MAVATRTVRGGSAFAIYPLNRYRRLELVSGLVHYQERYNDPNLQWDADQFQENQFGRQLFQNGTSFPLGVSFVQETTVFREFGPLSGNTMRLSYEYAPGVGSALARQTADVDARWYRRLGGSGLLALRAKGFRSWGESPTFTYFGGNSEMRGYEYLEFIGDNALFLNAELRFPFIEAMLTPVGILGGIRGVLFANMGGAHFKGQPFKWSSRSPTIHTPILDYTFDPFTSNRPIPVFGSPVPITGFRLVDSRASYGVGLETFALGFPIHFDWAWRTLFNKTWEDAIFAAEGGSARFRRARFSVWMGYDF
jgi:outer membrane protein assembly factor BamA